MLPVLALVLLSIGIPAAQALVWLKTGEWPSLPLSRAFVYFGWSLPEFDWIGVQKIANYALDLPVALWAFTAACSLIFTVQQIWAR